MPALQFGLDRLLTDPALRRPLRGRRLALLAHPASVSADLRHALDALAALPDLRLTAAFGPQHGLRGDKQDNMVESPEFLDPLHHIPVFSLYGAVRRPTPAMMATFDVLLVDLQDLGCRIYTFITTLRYVLEAAAEHGKAVWILDRPNPAGRPLEGLLLRPGLGKLRRRRAAADAARSDDGRTRRLVHQHAWLSTSDCTLITMQDWAPRRRPAMAGRSSSAAGSTPARTPRTCRWRAAMPAR
jgi:uncharacterized protein YbbC (DUF1343 family)